MYAFAKSIVALSSILISTSAFGAACTDKAVDYAVSANQERTNAQSTACGAKLLSSGDYIETFLVCVTDETDPSEWIVIVEKEELNHGDPTGETCLLQYAGAQFDNRTPTFD